MHVECENYNMSFVDSEDDENVCPVCFEKMDKTDLHLFPCPCGFQVSEKREALSLDLYVVSKQITRGK